MGSGRRRFYTLNDPRIVRDSNTDVEDNQLSFRDADSLNVGLTYETPRGVYAAIAIILRNLSSYYELLLAASLS
jgi:vitamin B12 transporter